MAINCVVHLRSWVIEEVESILEASPDRTLRWAIDLTTALLAGRTLTALILDSASILPPTSFARFLQFALRSYTSEVTCALGAIVQQHAAQQHADPAGGWFVYPADSLRY